MIAGIPARVTSLKAMVTATVDSVRLFRVISCAGGATRETMDEYEHWCIAVEETSRIEAHHLVYTRRRCYPDDCLETLVRQLVN